MSEQKLQIMRLTREETQIPKGFTFLARPVYKLRKQETTERNYEVHLRHSLDHLNLIKINNIRTS